MGKTVTICIGILLSLTILSVVSGNIFTGVTDSVNFDTISFINGSSTSWGDGTYRTLDLGIDPLEGALVWFIALAVIIGIFTFQVLGSGLGEVGQRTIRTTLMYGGIWGILSVLVWSLMQSIPIFGNIIWISLTILYAIGVFQKMGESG